MNKTQKDGGSLALQTTLRAFHTVYGMVMTTM